MQVAVVLLAAGTSAVAADLKLEPSPVGRITSRAPMREINSTWSREIRFC
jgi:hypothetical protein